MPVILIYGEGYRGTFGVNNTVRQQKHISAKAYFTNQQYLEAIAEYQSILKTLVDFSMDMAICYHNVASCYRRLGEYKQAYVFYCKAQEVVINLEDSSKVETEDRWIQEVVKVAINSNALTRQQKIALLHDEIIRHGFKVELFKIKQQLKAQPGTDFSVVINQVATLRAQVHTNFLRAISGAVQTELRKNNPYMKFVLEMFEVLSGTAFSAQMLNLG